MNKRPRPNLILIVPVVIIFAAAAWAVYHAIGVSQPPIRVGILHSFTGTMAISEIPVAEAEQLAVAEINASGGLLGGRKVMPILADGCSDWPTFAKQARQLLLEKKVCAVFGCWTSASRKTVRPIFEQLSGLLFYPVQYEGLEESPNIIYLGAAPNQQIIPAVKWTFDNLGHRFYLVGSDYVFPRAANAVIKDQVKALGGSIVGEDYIPMGESKTEAVVARIKAAHPDVILNTINGDTNIAFFRSLRAAGIDPGTIPTVSFSIGENELPALNPSRCVGELCSLELFSDAGGSPQSGIRPGVPKKIRGRSRGLRSHGSRLLCREIVGPGGRGGRHRKHGRRPENDSRPEHGRARGSRLDRSGNEAYVAVRPGGPHPRGWPVYHRLGLGTSDPTPTLSAIPHPGPMGKVPRYSLRALAGKLGRTLVVTVPT
jgi:ABC-type branched-subunit amino acid transport system substrate-binding protein